MLLACPSAIHKTDYPNTNVDSTCKNCTWMENWGLKEVYLVSQSNELQSMEQTKQMSGRQKKKQSEAVNLQWIRQKSKSKHVVVIH